MADEKQEARAWNFLNTMSDMYPHRIEGPASVSGYVGDKFGECISRPVPAGRKTWAFANADDRDRFADFLTSAAARRARSSQENG